MAPWSLTHPTDMGLGTVGGGFLYDRLGDYVSMFTGAFPIAAAAVLLAIALRSPRATFPTPSLTPA